MARAVEDLSLATLAVTAAIIAAAGLVHGTLGMGFPVVATPVLALMVDVRSAVLITLLPTAAVNLGSIFNGADRGGIIRRFWPLAAYSVLGTVVGTHALVELDPAPFKLLLATLVLLYLAVAGRESAGLPWVRRHPAVSMFVFGLLAGIAGGTTNVMLPVLIVYTLELGLRRTPMIQVFNLCFLAGKLTQMAVFFQAGLFTVQVAVITAPLALLAAAALVLGMRLREHIPTATYRHFVKALLLVLAVLLVAQYLLGH
jgi:uncharacterized membrane protein YfcA